MKRLAVVASLLVGAAFVFAQTTQTTQGKGFQGGLGSDSGFVMQHHGDSGMVKEHGEMDTNHVHVMDSTKHIPDFDTANFGEKFRDAMHRGGCKMDSARQARKDLWEKMKDSADVDTGKVMGQHRQMKRERMQGAIDALERVSERMGTQVKGQQDQTQVRIQERRDELIQQQQRIREKKTTDGSTTTTTTTTTESAN
jgi:hypothetical protein